MSFFRNICKKILRSKLGQPQVIGKDYIFCFDFSTEDVQPQIRICFIKSVNENGCIKVRVPYYNDTIKEIYYDSKSKNYYFVDQKDIVEQYSNPVKSTL